MSSDQFTPGSQPGGHARRRQPEPTPGLGEPSPRAGLRQPSLPDEWFGDRPAAAQAPQNEASQRTVIRPLKLDRWDADPDSTAVMAAIAVSSTNPWGADPTEAYLDNREASYYPDWDSIGPGQDWGQLSGDQPSLPLRIDPLDHARRGPSSYPPPPYAGRHGQPQPAEQPPIDADAAALGGAPAEPSVGRSSLIMALGTMVSRGLGMVRQVMLTAVIGASLASNAFPVANTLPNYIYILLSAGVLNAILLPQITKAMKRTDGGRDFVNRLVTASVGLVFVVALLATVASPVLVGATSNLSDNARHLAILFAYVCMPQIAFYGLYAVLGQVLNARNQFAAFMWTPVLANVVQIAGLVWFLIQWGRVGPDQLWSPTMIWVLAGSTTLGIAVQGLALIIPLYRGGFRFKPTFGLRGQGFGSASRMLGWTFTALVLAQLGGFFVQWVITSVRSTGQVPGVLTRDNAFLLFMLPHSFVTTSILTALFPRLSRSVQSDDVREQRRLVLQGLELPAVAVIPMSAGLIALAYPLFGFLFAPSSAVGADTVHLLTNRGAWTLALMALGTMAFGITTLQQRYCFAREEGRKNLVLQALLTGVQVIVAGCALLVPVTWVVPMVALAQTLGNTVAAVAFIATARRDLGGLNLSRTVRLYVRLALVSTLAGLVCWGASALVGMLGTGRLVQLVQLAAGGMLFVVCFLALSKVMRITQVDDLLAPVLRRLKRS